MADTTRQLLPAAAARREGFAALHQRVGGRLSLWASLHIAPPLRSWLPVEDFVQDVWARAYEAFPRFDQGRGDFRAWLFGLAYNVLREHLRSLRLRQRQRPPASEPEELQDGATSVVGRVAAADDRSLLLAAVADFGLEDRRLLIWRGIEELPYAEIGRRLAISADAAESRWRRVAERLRQRLPRALCARYLDAAI